MAVPLAKALVADPVKTTTRTAKGFKDMAVGAPGAIVATAVETAEGTKEGDPLRGVKRAGKEFVEDAIRRYRPLAKPGGEKEFVERIKKEGLAAEIVDAGILVSGPGGGAARLVTIGAKSGRLGSPAQRIATEPRRRVRTSGGISREQSLAPQFFKARRQKRRDERAFRGQQRQVERADAAARRRQARDPDGNPARGRVDAVVREATARGEVVPSRLTVTGRRVPSARKLAKAQRVEGVARPKGRTLIAVRRAQRAEGLTGGAHGAARLYAGLSAAEKRAYKTALQLAPKSTRAGVAAVKRRIAQIEANRKEDPSGVDELPVLRKILEAPEKHFTGRLLAIVDEERARGARVAERDPGMGDTVPERRLAAELRRRAPQFATLGVRREGTPIRQAEADARERRDRGRREAGKADTALARAERKAGRERGRRDLLREQATPAHREQVDRADRAVAIHMRAAANHRRRAARARSTETREAYERLAKAAERRAQAASGRRDEMLGLGPKRTRKADRRVESAEGAVKAARDRKAQIRDEIREAGKVGRELRAARRRGVELVDAEDVEAFLERGRAVAEGEGLGEPAYFQSAPRETVLRSLFTSGGFRSVPRDKRYTGKLFAEGREDGSFTTYSQGLARSIKRQHNWDLVTDVVDANAFEWGRGRSVEALRQELDRRGIDPSTVGFWNPGVFREARQAIETGDVSERGRLGDADAIFDTPEDDAWGQVLAGEHLLAEGMRLARDTGRFSSSQDWVVLPKAVLDELEADTRPSGFFGRSMDVVKGFQARVLLGTSPAWLQFQVASNLLLTTMAGVGPVEIVRMNMLWRRLPEEVKAAAEPYVGTGAFHDSLDKVRIGAASDAGLVNAYRAFKAHPFWHRPRKPLAGAAISQLNPLDVLFRLDNWQNNQFRRAVLVNRAKRDAYARMGENVALQQRILDRVTGHLAPGRLPEEKIRGLLQDRQLLERYAESVREFLGDYQTYTTRERRLLNRNIMFYGFLRFSLRFTFYTMPVRHTTMAGILGQLGRLQTEEVRELLGGDELPWAMGRFFYTKGGELRSINVARANPFLNTLTELNPTIDPLAQLRNVMRLLPPVWVSLANQAFSKSSFRDRPYRVEGETTGRRTEEYGFENRVRIFANDMARLVAIYRAADVAAAGGAPQGDDSILGDRPLEYKDPQIRAGIEESKKRFEDRGGFGAAFGRDLVPILGEPDDSPEVARKRREQAGNVQPVDMTDPVQRRAAIERAKKAAESVGKMSAEERRAAIARAKAAAP